MNAPAPPPMQPAGMWRRAAARAIDVLVRVVVGLAVYVAAGSVAIVIAQPDMLSSEGWGTFNYLLVLFGAPALLTVFGYEVVSTVCRGQTFGKRCMGIQVVQWCGPVADAECPDPRGSVVRFGVPHLAAVIVGALAGLVSVPKLGGWAVLIGVDAGLGAWMLVYASSLWDPNGRGWHDKLAGTVVLTCADLALLESRDLRRPSPGDGHDSAGRGEQESPTVAGRGVVVIVVCAVLVGAALVGGVGFVVVDAVVSSFEDDTYDEEVRERAGDGLVVGPDGDACWPENDSLRNGTLFCELVSIGGLNWDTGDVRITGSVGIWSRFIVGSGYMCLLNDGVPWCWEWSPSVQPPRPARVPQGTVFRTIAGDDGFVCGQTPDYVTVTCWTIGVNQRNYQQGGRQFPEGPKWHMISFRDDPPSFYAEQFETGRFGQFHAFTGEAVR